MRKNDIFETVCTDITDKGLGVGKAENMTVFIKDAAVGDHLKIKLTALKKNYAFANIEEITEKSKDRIEVDCPVFSKCGGCSLRHISYPCELSLKEKRVSETIKRIGGVDIKPSPIISDTPFYYRNKAEYPLCENGIGFFRAHSHDVVATRDCLLSPPEFSSAANAFFDFVKQHNIPIYNEITHKGLVRHFFIRKGFTSGEIQAVVVINGEKLPFEDELVNVLKKVSGDNLKSVVVNINQDKTNVILGDKCRTVWGSDTISDTLCGVKVRLSPFSFYQVNSKMAEKLYKKAAEYAEPEGKTVLDLYCGTGTIGLSMAHSAKNIIGVEIVKEAVRDAEFNAKENGIENARFICSRAVDAVGELEKEGLSPDVVILDPPRKGCDERLLNTVANGFCPEKIVYVSCDVSTLARDIKILSSLGYSLKEYTPCDLFPRTSHVESVVLLNKVQNPITYLNPQ